MPALDTRDTKERIRELLVVSAAVEKLVQIKPTMAEENDLLRYHRSEYLGCVRAISERGGGDVGEGAWMGPNCYEIARLSAGACAIGIEAVLDRAVDNVYVLARPAGHHATRDVGRGFCIFSSIPVAILKAQAAGKVRRVAVVDWDVHHGNGMQDAFYQDPNVLAISIHQAGNYPPGSGELEERLVARRTACQRSKDVVRSQGDRARMRVGAGP